MSSTGTVRRKQGASPALIGVLVVGVLILFGSLWFAFSRDKSDEGVREVASATSTQASKAKNVKKSAAASATAAQAKVAVTKTAAQVSPIVVSDELIRDCVVKALAKNGDTWTSARRIAIGAHKDIAGVDTSFSKGDTYWGFCEESLKDPHSFQVAQAKTKMTTLATEVVQLTKEKAAIEAKLTKASADYQAAKTLVARLEQPAAATSVSKTSTTTKSVGKAASPKTPVTKTASAHAPPTTT